MNKDFDKPTRIIRLQFRKIFLFLIFLKLCGGLMTVSAQDDREVLGPMDVDPSEHPWAQKPHPLTETYNTVKAELREELQGQHPRVYVTSEGLDTLRERARTTHKEQWQYTLDNLHALNNDPTPAPAQERRVQNVVGIAIAEAALAYKIEGDKKYLNAAKRFMDAAVSYDVWGYEYHKPNVDLAAGHLLYGMGWGYDLLFHDLTESERKTYRDKMIRQAKILYEYYELKDGRSYSYSQNHVYIPMSGLAVTAYALYDELSEAADWARLARTLFDRVLDTYSSDGYYYEGIEYWVFSTPWLFHYIDAHAHATGEELHDIPGFRKMHKYVAHSMLPDGQNVFDFGDIFEGAITRRHEGEDYKRTHPGGRFHTNYNMIYRLASWFQNPEAQGVADWLHNFNQLSAESYWTLLWYDPSVPSSPMSDMKPWYYFEDHEVVYWRSDWTKDATAFSFKSGPPEGHSTKELQEKFPDWHLEMGHAHPDANSFIIYSNGQYMTGDTGWTGLPMTEHHNTILVDGQGQAREGEGHNVFHGIPYERLDSIRIDKVELESRFAYIRGNAASAYEPELGVNKFYRDFIYVEPDKFVIVDYIETKQPSLITSYLHADQKYRKVDDNTYLTEREGVKMKANVLSSVDFNYELEPNLVVSPGDPGSVDEGETQQRGYRMAINTSEKSEIIRIVKQLEIIGQ